MSSPLPHGMMQTHGGVRIAVRPDIGHYDAPVVAVSIQGISFDLATGESHELRDLLQAAELRTARGDVIT